MVPSNVSLIQLPPYSPELNPVENLWHYLRAHHWSNRRYRDYDALQEEAVRSLCAVREDTETIKTVCNPPYISRVHEIAGKRITRSWGLGWGGHRRTYLSVLLGANRQRIAKSGGSFIRHRITPVCLPGPPHLMSIRRGSDPALPEGSVTGQRCRRPVIGWCSVCFPAHL